MTLKKIINRGVELSYDNKKSIENLFEDTLIVYGARKPKNIIKWYSIEYGITERETLRNLDRFKQYIKSGDITRYNK